MGSLTERCNFSKVTVKLQSYTSRQCNNVCKSFIRMRFFKEIMMLHLYPIIGISLRKVWKWR